jgi:hypothetical protein
LKDFLEFSGQRDIYGSRDTTRKAFELGLIEDGESWMDMLQSRNLTSYTYNEAVAEEICQAVIGVYHPFFRKLDLKRLNRIRCDLDDLLLPYTVDISIFHQIHNQDLIDHIQQVGIVIYRRDAPEGGMRAS